MELVIIMLTQVKENQARDILTDLETLDFGQALLKATELEQRLQNSLPNFEGGNLRALNLAVSLRVEIARLEKDPSKVDGLTFDSKMNYMKSLVNELSSFSE